MSNVAERTVTNHGAPSTLGPSECIERPRVPDHFVDQAIKREIEKNGAHAFYFSQVTYKCSGGKVWVCGRVPTDRLKHALGSLILGLDGVTEIDNQLDVVSSTGLSSIRPR